MNYLESATVFVGVVAFFNLLLLVTCVFLFMRSKKAIEFSRKVLELHADSKKEVLDRFEKLLNEEVAKILEAYGKSLKQVTDDNLKGITSVAGEQMKGLSDAIRLQEELISKQGVSMIDELISQAREEIAKYKTMQQKEIEDEVPEIVEKVSREVLNRSINLSEHEDLVWAAMERAKAEGIFGEGQMKDSAPGVNVPLVAEVKKLKAKISKSEARNTKQIQNT